MDPTPTGPFTTDEGEINGRDDGPEVAVKNVKENTESGSFVMEQLGNIGLVVSATGQALEGSSIASIGTATLGRALDHGGDKIGGVALVYDGYQYHKGNLSGARFGYHAIGYGASFIAARAVSGAAGLETGGAFFYLEATYDMGNLLWQSFKASYNDWYNSYMTQITGH